MLTAGKIIEQVKADLALLPKSVATSNETGAYFSMKEYGKALFVFAAAAIAATKTVVAQVMKAADGVGTGATALTGATATITANTAVKKALLTGNTIADEDTVVTINGVVFSCEDTSPDIDAGEFASGANDTAACVELAAAINHLLPDIKATPSTSTVILELREPGTGSITIEDAHSTIVPSTLEAEGYVEVDASQLGDGFSHVALKLTTDATIVVSGQVIRSGAGGGQPTPVPFVAAAKVL